MAEDFGSGYFCNCHKISWSQCDIGIIHLLSFLFVAFRGFQIPWYTWIWVYSRKFLIIHLEVSILLFTFAPVMLGQASAIKVRNQVSEYPPLSKLAGCFLYPGIGCKVTTKITFLALSFLLFSHFRRFPLFIYLSIPFNLDILPITFSLSTYYIMGRNDYLCNVESWRIVAEDYFFEKKFGFWLAFCTPFPSVIVYGQSLKPLEKGLA